MQLYRFLIIGFLTVSINSFSQEFLNRDSLWKEFEKSAADTNRVLLYIQLGQQYENNNPDSALLLYEGALALSRELNYTMGIIKYYTNATYVYNILGRYDTALLLNLQSVDIARAYGNKERLAACLGNVGSSYINLKNYEASVEYTLKALEVYAALKMVDRLSSVSSNLSIIYREIGQMDKALEYAKNGLAYGRQSGNSYHILVALNNLALVHIELNHLDEAITLLNESLILSKETDNVWSQITVNLNLVDANIQKGRFNELKPFLDETMRLSKEVDDTESIVIAQRGYSIYYLYSGMIDQAEKFGMESLKIAQQNNYPFHIYKAMDQLSKIALVNKNYTLSNHYAYLSDSIQNSMFNERIAGNIQGIEAEFNSKQQQAQILELEETADRNRIYMISLVVALLAVAAIVALAYRTYFQKKKIHDRDSLLQQSRIDQLEKEKQLMASEAIIRGQEEERARMAKDLHDGLGGMLSGVKFSLTNMKTSAVLDSDSALVFERAMDMLDHSIQELRRVAHNMMPEVLVKFGLREAVRSFCESIQQTKLIKIDFNAIEVTERFGREVEIQSFRIIQELLNNVLRHAKATHVLVQLSVHNHQLFITVEDDGIGFDKEKLEDKNSAGLANIRNRLDLLNGKMEIDSSPNGTTIEINIALP